MTSYLDRLVGKQLPGGFFAIEPYEDWLLRDVFLAPAEESGRLHTMWAFAALQRSIGMTLDELFILCEASPELPPLLGESEVEVLAPMRPGQRYTVNAEIADVQRKAGRRSGLMDVVKLRAEALQSDGSTIARLLNSYIFPRSDT